VAIEPFDLAALRYFTGTQSPEPSIPKYSTLTSKA
jgi:hypothetical protein